jgi:hypothetical protein
MSSGDGATVRLHPATEETDRTVAGFGWRSKRAAEGGLRAETPDELIKLVVDYLKQETLTPLSGLGKFLIFGITGSIALALGVILLLLAVLRVLQTETGAFHGNLSWIPYLIVTVLAGGIIALAAWRVGRGPAERRRPEPETGGR